MATARAFEDIKNIRNFLVKKKALGSIERRKIITQRHSHISGYKMSHLN
jgi:hypothetical protein